MKPATSWYGGKTRLAPTIAALLPPHRSYIEPFCGSAAVLFAKQPSPIEVINDLDGAVVNFFRVLRAQPDELQRQLALSPYSRAEWHACRDIDDASVTDLERARRFFVRVTQSFAAKPGPGTGWSCSTSRVTPPSVTTASAVERLQAVAARLRRVAIEQCDAVELIGRLARSDSVLYVDPPYVFDTRKDISKRGSAGDYRHELPDDGHVRLAATLHACPGHVLLSGYPSPLYDELYRGWHHIDFAAFASAGARKGAQLGRRTERLWSNRPFTIGSLFDHRSVA